ncbi:hypothetical protein ABZ946_33980 [Streptomyces sp. NPDC046324]|uniref:hypothetical protein n=1 Tax=Streptomyces sp. NPDC046324 TaxID=3154915 RepID=UPI0033DC5144
MLADKGIRPTIPAPSDTSTATITTAELNATRTYRHLLPDLRLTIPNLVRATEAMARLAQLGWVPLEGYPGADQPWLMECRLCGWQGRRFWSHLRGRNGDRTPRPANRHPGCIPVKEIHAEIISLAAERSRECPCEFSHPTEIGEALSVLASIGIALNGGNTVSATLYARAILEPCPASTRRANVLGIAHNRRSDALRSVGK